jgi:phosphate transport system substrate-binding protein
MAFRKGKCTNFGNCTNADKFEVVEIPDGQDFVCPICARPLNAVEARPPSSSAPIAIALIALLLLAGGLWYYFRHRAASGGAAAPASNSGGAVAPAPVAAGNANVILRLHGSNTIGAQLVPALAQAYLRQQGAQDVKIVPGAADEVTVEGAISGARQAIEVAAHGSATAFTDLAAGKCDIGMSSRKIKPEEAANLSSLGDMTSSACEHVLGLDGVAIMVNRSNPVASLSTTQLAGIFSGEIGNWSDVGGTSHPFKIYARDDKSGTYDTFKSLVLGNRSLSSSATRIEDSRQLADKVANDPDAIGFVGLPYVDGAKAISVSEKGAAALLPTRLTVATEDYPLSRRLYLYAAANPTNANVRRFIDFALGKQGQDVVADSGFVAQNVKTENVSVPINSPAEYSKLTAGAQRLSLNFRFRTGSSELDNKAIVDLDRVVTFISDLRYSGKDVLLFGFADSTGSEAANDRLAKERAQTVADQFAQRGLKAGLVTGFGSHNPVASNDTDDGRQKNRRVEIWVKKPGA